MAPTGHTFMHAMHSLHLAWSTLALLDSRWIASWGHTWVHSPHPLHDSSLTIIILHRPSSIKYSACVGRYQAEVRSRQLHGSQCLSHLRPISSHGP